ncbi:hypothetical protein F0344_12770 [Streptomyces finlayi]|uniref:LPXTG cell wall anchor domain-containing protein n=1 Tax=Streptomyces finlayi TaxID=67296 RepID=A0A7G7BJ61_9ACTN|nr:hypothetical protein [Streptomyces finlayi]QNE75376.1 hypothetical protein F0344_12770 [Streptomyces finlayi]
MSIARRTLLTTTAAGTLLCALWFVPSANATGGSQTEDAAGSVRNQSAVTPARRTDADTVLADTGAGVDTTPYLIGGTAFLLIGAGFVTYSARTGPSGGPSVN